MKGIIMQFHNLHIHMFVLCYPVLYYIICKVTHCCYTGRRTLFKHNKCSYITEKEDNFCRTIVIFFNP